MLSLNGSLMNSVSKRYFTQLHDACPIYSQAVFLTMKIDFLQLCILLLLILHNNIYKNCWLSYKGDGYSESKALFSVLLSSCCVHHKRHILFLQCDTGFYTFYTLLFI